MRLEEGVGMGEITEGGSMDANRREPVHIPVLAEEVIKAIGAECERDCEGWFVDATLGAAGHSTLLLEAFPKMRLLGTDQDPEILALARERLAPFGDRVHIESTRLSDLGRLIRKLRIDKPVAMLMDLGVSSLQLDRPERGFSFQYDGPLDMRMDPTRERTAAEIVNNWDERDLADLFFYEGGETRARGIATAIVEARHRSPFRRTGAFADLVARAVGRPAGGGKVHPATKVFAALRRAVNEETEELRAGLEVAENWLADGGVLAAIAFHHAEDGEVKRFLKEGSKGGRWDVRTKKPIKPQHAEERANRRARSALMRIGVRKRGAGE